MGYTMELKKETSWVCSMVVSTAGQMVDMKAVLKVGSKDSMMGILKV